MTAGVLYVVATPLGHLGDLSARAAATLRAVDLVAAEDTRRTRGLLSHLAAHPELVSLHAHSPPGRVRHIIAQLAAGRSVALVSDAGTPGVSDPGPEVVRAARAAGVSVTAIPGPSAVATALSVSGFPADRYLFLGFIPRKGTDRSRLLELTVQHPWSVVLFEAPPRLTRLLRELAAAGGDDRRAAVARELTKVHEEVRIGTLSMLAAYYEEHEPRGEVTVVLAGTGAPTSVAVVDPALVRERARALLAAGVSRRDAAARLATEFPVSRNDAYRFVMEAQ